MTANIKLDRSARILVAGGGGFIGGHLVQRLLDQGYENLCVVDIKPLDEWYQVFDTADNRVQDLRRWDNCQSACQGASHVYNLACDMGGMGFIENNRALCMISVLINTHLLLARATRACSGISTPVRLVSITPTNSGLPRWCR